MGFDLGCGMMTADRFHYSAEIWRYFGSPFENPLHLDLGSLSQQYSCLERVAVNLEHYWYYSNPPQPSNHGSAYFERCHAPLRRLVLAAAGLPPAETRVVGRKVAANGVPENGREVVSDERVADPERQNAQRIADSMLPYDRSMHSGDVEGSQVVLAGEEALPVHRTERLAYQSPVGAQEFAGH